MSADAALSLAEAFAARPAPRAGTPCTVGMILALLDPADAATLRELVTQPNTATRLSDTLRDMGHEVSAATLQRHGNGRCKCPR